MVEYSVVYKTRLDLNHIEKPRKSLSMQEPCCQMFIWLKKGWKCVHTFMVKVCLWNKYYSITIIWHKYNKLLAALSVDGGHQYIRPPSVGNSLPHEWSIPFHLDLLGPDIQNSPLLWRLQFLYCFTKMLFQYYSYQFGNKLSLVLE